MTGRVEGKVAFVTGAGRGMGRSHALRLASEGADVIAVDVCRDIDSVPYPMSTWDDLVQTAKMVEDLGRRAFAQITDVRDLDELRSAVATGISQLGHIDIVAANAGIASTGRAWEIGEAAWRDMVDINLTGVWNSCKAAIPHMIEQGTGGAIVITSSLAGTRGIRNIAHYTAAKHGVVGLMRSLANELAEYMIRVNTVHPNNINTDMLHNDAFYSLMRPDMDRPGIEDVRSAYVSLNLLPVPWIDPIEVSHAVLFLASDEAKYITGASLSVDCGAAVKT